MAVALADPAAGAEERGISTRELLLWTSAIFVGTTVAKFIAGNGTGTTVDRNTVSAVDLAAWGCVLLLLRRSPAQCRASAVQIMGFLLLSTTLILSSEIVRYAGLTGIALLVLLGPNWSAGERRASAILLMIASQKLWMKPFKLFFADWILRADTAMAGYVLRVLVPGSTWSAHGLRPPDGVGITVAMGCSSFANLSLAWLLFGSIYVLDGGRPSRPAFLVLALICAMVLTLNTLRLLVMARSIDNYVYWHEGSGAHIFAIVVTFLTFLMSSYGSRWAIERS